MAALRRLSAVEITQKQTSPELTLEVAVAPLLGHRSRVAEADRVKAVQRWPIVCAS